MADPAPEKVEPQPEAPKEEPPKVEAPKEEPPQVEAPKEEPPKAQTPPMDSQVPEPIKSERKVETPIPEAARPEPPKELPRAPMSKGFANLQNKHLQQPDMSLKLSSRFGDKTMALLKDENLSVAEREALY